MKPILVDPLKINVTPRSVLKRMGRGLDERKWMRLICRVYDEYWPTIRPRGIYRLSLCRPNGSTVEIGGNLKFESTFLESHLTFEKLAAVFLVTIGHELEQSIGAEIEGGKNRKAYILDCLGSSAAESAAAAINRKVEERLNLPMRRYSPGYNDWHISQQRILFDYLGEDNVRRVGVELTPDFMMAPRKSVSGLIIPRTERAGVFPPRPAVINARKWPVSLQIQ